jgi:hypothetical protein
MLQWNSKRTALLVLTLLAVIAALLGYLDDPGSTINFNW